MRAGLDLTPTQPAKHMGPMWAPYGLHMGPIWAANMVFENRFHMGHIWVTYMGPIYRPMWGLYGFHMGPMWALCGTYMGPIYFHYYIHVN